MHHLLTLSALLGVLTIAVPNGLHGASPGGAFGDGRGNGILKVQLLTPDFENRANDEDAFYQHAGIEVDPDIQTFLQRAYTYAESHQYDTVARLLQKVVDDGRGTLLNVAPRVYRPADMAAIAMLTELPEDALDTYRILVDPIAGAMFEAPGTEHNQETLEEISRRYFLSSYGDDATYLLACLCINRGDFAKARRLLYELQQHYPEADMSVKREDILIRLALAAAHGGDFKQAREAWQEVAQKLSFNKQHWTSQIEQRVLESGKLSRHENSAYEQTKSALGNGDVGELCGPSLPPQVEKAKALLSTWEQNAGMAETSYVSAASVSELALITQQWVEQRYWPNDAILVDDKYLYASAATGIQCYRKYDGTRQWRTSGEAPFEIDKLQELQNISLHNNRQHDFLEAALFHDRVGGAISLHKDTVFRIEGNWQATQTRRRVRRNNNWTYIIERKGNYLAAYDREDGNRRWLIGGGNESDEGLFSGCRFLNAPVPCGNNILVTLEKNNALYVVALNPADGHAVWQHFLCSYMVSAAPPGKPVGLSVTDSEAYLATGHGLVFALDGLSGRIHWASAYEVETSTDAQPREQDAQTGRAVSGWLENFSFPIGANLLVLPADSSNILCFDRSSGILCYKIGQAQAIHPIGLSDRALVVAGTDFVRAHSIETGEVLWQQSTQPSTGRGVVTRDRVLVPHYQSLSLLSTKDGQLMAALNVGRDHNLPLGNLSNDGHRLYAAGLTHVSSLASGQSHLEALGAQVREAPTAQAYLARGSHYMKASQYDNAVNDLRKALSMAGSDPRQAQISQLKRDIAEIQKRKTEIWAQLAWYRDNFEREHLGPDYQAKDGKATVENGTLRLYDGNNLLAGLNKEIPGNFIVEIDAWQNERPSDLSFMLSIQGPKRTVDTLYVQFGCNWNTRNRIQVDSRSVAVTDRYLIEPGKKHHLVMTRIGNTISLVVDGISVLEKADNAIPDSDQTTTTLNLYGYGEDHFYDNLVIKLLDKDGKKMVTADVAKVPAINTHEEVLYEQLSVLDENETSARNTIRELRQKGCIDTAIVRQALLETLLNLAGQKESNGHMLLDEAQVLVQTPEEKRTWLVASAENAVAQGDFNAAVDWYFRILREIPTQFLRPAPQKPGWGVGRTQWVRMKLETLYQNHGPAVAEAIESAVARGLEHLDRAEGVSCEDYYRLMQAFPNTPSAIAAGVKASIRAEKEGNIARAEMILLVMTANVSRQTRAASLAALGKLYERLTWNYKAYRTWQTLKERYPLEKLHSDTTEKTAAGLAQLSLTKLAEKGFSNRTRRAPGMPSPPYDLLWQRKQRGMYPLRQFTGFSFFSPFFEKHLFMLDTTKERLTCMDLKNGDPLWEATSFLRRHQLVFHGHIVFNFHPKPQALSLITGQTLWTSDISETAGRHSINRLILGNGVLFATGNTTNRGSVLYALDAVTGETLWLRVKLQQQRPNVQVCDGYLVDMARTSHNNQTRTWSIYDQSSGRLINRHFPQPNGPYVFTGSGLLTVEGKKLVLHRLPDGREAWSRELRTKNQIHVRNVLNHHTILVATSDNYLLIDPATQEVEWQIKAEDNASPHSPQVFYNADSDQLVIMRQYRKKDDKQYWKLHIVDADSGERQTHVDLDNTLRLNTHGDVAMNDHVVAAMETVYETENNRKRIVGRHYRLVRRDNGTLVPDVHLPRRQDLAENEKTHYFRLFATGNTIICTGGNKILIYGHHNEN